MPRTTTLLTSAAGAAALALTAPAVGSAATVTVDRSCYAHVLFGNAGSQPVIASVTGGTPGARFQVIATVPGKGEGSAGSNTGTFDAAGNGVTSIENVTAFGAGISPTAGRKIDISVKDFGNGVLTPGPSPRVTNVAADVSSKPTNPRRARKVRASAGSAFANKQIYGFVTKGTSRKVLRRVSLGKGNACGYVSRKAVIAPKNYRTGTYRLYINPGKSLSKRNALLYQFRIFRRYF